jgi:hypothetical protein
MDINIVQYKSNYSILLPPPTHTHTHAHTHTRTHTHTHTYTYTQFRSVLIIGRKFTSKKTNLLI